MWATGAGRGAGHTAVRLATAPAAAQRELLEGRERTTKYYSFAHRLVRDDEVGGVEALGGHVRALRGGARDDAMAAVCARA